MKRYKQLLGVACAGMFMFSAAGHAETKIKIFAGKVEIDQSLANRVAEKFGQVAALSTLAEQMARLEQQMPDANPTRVLAKKNAMDALQAQATEILAGMTADADVLKAVGVRAGVFKSDMDVNDALALSAFEIYRLIAAANGIDIGAAMPGMAAQGMGVPTAGASSSSSSSSSSGVGVAPRGAKK